MITAFKKHIHQPWHKITKTKRIYEFRGKYNRHLTTPRKSFMLP
jgi:hypothetical protein